MLLLSVFLRPPAWMAIYMAFLTAVNYVIFYWF